MTRLAHVSTPTVRSFRHGRAPVAFLAIAIVTLTACGGGGGDRSGQTTRPDEPGPVAAGELARAREVVVQFVEALGAGKIGQAARVVGPISEQRADEAGGLERLLRASTEGHGAWAASEDRVVTPIGIDAGIVAVMLEGTVRVEGTTEHRIEVFPVRKAESANAWFVEPWAYDVTRGKPVEIASPAVDDEELASVDPADSLAVTVEAVRAGRVFVSFDARPPSSLEIERGGSARFTGEADADETPVAVVLASGPVLAGTGFRARSREGTAVAATAVSDAFRRQGLACVNFATSRPQIDAVTDGTSRSRSGVEPVGPVEHRGTRRLREPAECGQTVPLSTQVHLDSRRSLTPVTTRSAASALREACQCRSAT
jgi:hypothetical protein